MKKKIAIIGAGIAGLTLANLLKKNSSFEFMVYEKDNSLSLDEGFGIQLSPNSVSVLNKIGFNKINPEKIYHPKILNFCTIQTKKICDLDLSQFNTGNTHYTTLQRSILIHFLIENIFQQHLRFGKRIKKVSEIKDKILISFDDNTNDLVDNIVACDGVFSNTRSFFEIKKYEPKFKNAIAIRTILQSKNGLDIDDKNINLLMGSNLHMVIYPVNKKKELNLVCILREKNFDTGNTKSLIKKKLLSQNKNLSEVFRGEMKSWPLYSGQKIIPTSNKKVFYLGDAFHGFLPTFAQGASQSIEGALELFILLEENNNDIHKLYFKKRSERTNLIKKRSDLNFFVFHIKNLILKKIRDIILKRLVKNKTFLKNYIGEIYKN